MLHPKEAVRDSGDILVKQKKGYEELVEDVVVETEKSNTCKEKLPNLFKKGKLKNHQVLQELFRIQVRTLPQNSEPCS